MSLSFDPDKSRRRAMATKLQVMENMIRSRLENGGPLTAQEIMDGVRLSHEDFLYLSRLTMTALNAELRRDVPHQPSKG